MATDFFERQAVARRNTAWLVLMFLLAVIGIVGVVFFVASFAATELQASGLLESTNSFYELDQQDFPWEIPLTAAAATLVVLIGGTLYKVSALRAGGGTLVAESMGGKRLYPDSAGLTERRVLNVVEEMALASGTPVPPVYLMEEQGINAFAAGFSPSDAVVGVTRGCAENLSRDELQGVIAHEFSHILNGDMRMSIRMIGILHGILLLGLIGQAILRALFYSGGSRSRSKDDDNAGLLVIAAVALVLIVIGSIGSLVGGLIKAAVSRQREYLADASAVQFTRNPGGIAGALKRIGGFVTGSRLQHPRAAEASHMFFAQGVWEGLTGLMATHPPLTKRIKAIDRNWDGKFPRVEAPVVSSGIGSGAAAGFASQPSPSPSLPGRGINDASGSDIPLDVVDHAAEQIGEPTDAHRDYAHQLLEEIKPELLAAAREPYSARAVVFGLLLDRDLDVRAAQFAALDKLASADIADLTRRIVPWVVAVPDKARLPLVDLCLPALRAMSPKQFRSFSDAFMALIRADNRLGLFEWTLSKVLVRHLRPQFEPVRSPIARYYGLQKLGEPISVLLSSLAYSGITASEATQEQAGAAFDSAAKLLPEAGAKLLPSAQCNLNKLDEALRTLATVAAKHRGRIVDACAAAICHDQHVNVKEAELLRGISDLLDCPMPPLLAGQKVA